MIASLWSRIGAAARAALGWLSQALSRCQSLGGGPPPRPRPQSNAAAPLGGGGGAPVRPQSNAAARVLERSRPRSDAAARVLETTLVGEVASCLDVHDVGRLALSSWRCRAETLGTIEEPRSAKRTNSFASMPRCRRVERRRDVSVADPASCESPNSRSRGVATCGTAQPRPTPPSPDRPQPRQAFIQRTGSNLDSRKRTIQRRSSRRGRLTCLRCAWSISATGAAI